ncbi:MAG: D-aminoacyl-tRNA deacylase [Bacteroidota bacterium]
MRVIIQRVSSASVVIQNKVFNSIEKGLLVFVGFEESDSKDDIQWISKKIIDLRIFSDSDGKMNLSVLEIQGELLVISQFTLFASTKKGNRPSFIRSAKPEIAIPLYESFLVELALLRSTPIKTGIFGADMKVSLINDGPVTISIDSKNRE